MQERVDAAGAVSAFGSLVAAGAKDIRPEDLLPDWAGANGKRREQTADEMIAVMRGLMKPKGV